MIETDTDTNITIHKITKTIESNKMLEVTGDKVVICLLINFKCIVIVVDPRFPFLEYSTLQEICAL